MRATEIIRTLLDVIDEIDCGQQAAPIPAHAELEIVLPQDDPILHQAENPLTKPADQNHFKQIFDILSTQKHQMYDNSPAEVVAGPESVTTHAGGGWNGPKHPADIRADSVAMYPGAQDVS